MTRGLLVALVAVLSLPAVGRADDVAALYPDAATFAFGVDVKGIATSPLGKKVIGERQAVRRDPQAAEGAVPARHLPDHRQGAQAAGVGREQAGARDRRRRPQLETMARPACVFLEGEIDEDEYFKAAEAVAKAEKQGVHDREARRAEDCSWSARTSSPVYGLQREQVAVRDRHAPRGSSTRCWRSTAGKKTSEDAEGAGRDAQAGETDRDADLARRRRDGTAEGHHGAVSRRSRSRTTRTSGWRFVLDEENLAKTLADALRPSGGLPGASERRRRGRCGTQRGHHGEAGRHDRHRDRAASPASCSRRSTRSRSNHTSLASTGLVASSREPQTAATAKAQPQTMNAVSHPAARATPPSSTGDTPPPRFPHMFPKPSAAPTFFPPTSCANDQTVGLCRSTRNAITPSATITAHTVASVGIRKNASAQPPSVIASGTDRPEPRAEPGPEDVRETPAEEHPATADDQHHRLHPPALLQRHAERLVQVGRQERDDEHPADVHAELHRRRRATCSGVRASSPSRWRNVRPGLRGVLAGIACQSSATSVCRQRVGRAASGRPVADDEPEQHRDHQPAQPVDDEHAAPVDRGGSSPAGCGPGGASRTDRGHTDQRGRERCGQPRRDRAADPPAERDDGTEPPALLRPCPALDQPRRRGVGPGLRDSEHQPDRDQRENDLRETRSRA